MDLSKLITITLLCLFITTAKGQTYPIPQIDWDGLQKTKPWEATEQWSPVPSIVTPGITPRMAPSDAIVLFDGKNLDAWQKPMYSYGAKFEDTEAHVKNNVHEKFPGTAAEWSIEDGAVVVKPGGGNIATKQKFGSAQLHIEWLAPVDEGKEGQGYSNSGVFLMGLYEIQVLNSHNNKTYPNGQAGSVYKQTMPLVNANKPAGEWQIYDIIFTAPRFDKMGKIESPAYFTVFLNGVLVQNHTEVKGPTFYIGEGRYINHPEKMPLVLQDHGDKVRFRNIWIREL